MNVILASAQLCVDSKCDAALFQVGWNRQLAFKIGLSVGLGAVPLCSLLAQARQSKELRSLHKTVPYELDQIDGGHMKTEQMGMLAILHSKGYSVQGIEMSWAHMELQANTAQMAVSDDFASLAVDLSVAITEQHVRRNMVFSHGLPRRQVCLLDANLAEPFVKQLRADIELHERIKAMSFDGVELYLQRSVFTHVSVRQLIGCLGEENWQVTPGTPLGSQLLAHAASRCSGCVHVFTTLLLWFPWC